MKGWFRKNIWTMGVIFITFEYRMRTECKQEFLVSITFSKNALHLYFYKLLIILCGVQ